MRSALIQPLLLCAFLYACPQLQSADNSPNILFILADDMGWTDAGFAGSDLYETPYLDALAGQSMKFTNSYSACHVCSPTRASIMTGKYPARLALTDFIPGGKDRGMNSPAWTKYLPLHEVTIAEALKPAGYVCGHFGKWHLNKDKRYVEGRAMDPASQGFDDVLSTVKPNSKHDPTDDAHHAYEITRRAEKFMEANRDRPFFCYVAHHVLHTPLLGHPGVVPKFEANAVTAKNHKNAVYAAMVHDLDQSVGRLLRKLVDLDLVEQTLVIFTSDNGGLVSGSRRPPTSNFPLRDGKGTNYEGGIRVPTLVRWPGVVLPGTCDHPIISNDFYPTMLEIANTAGDQRHNTNVDGMSIVPLLKDPKAKLGRDAIYWHYPHYHSAGATPHGAIRVGKWKLIEFYDDGHVEMYDLESDIGETKDLAPAYPEKADALRAQLAAWRQKIGALMPTSE